MEQKDVIFTLIFQPLRVIKALHFRAFFDNQKTEAPEFKSLAQYFGLKKNAELGSEFCKSDREWEQNEQREGFRKKWSPCEKSDKLTLAGTQLVPNGTDYTTYILRFFNSPSHEG